MNLFLFYFNRFGVCSTIQLIVGERDEKIRGIQKQRGTAMKNNYKICADNMKLKRKCLI